MFDPFSAAIMAGGSLLGGLASSSGGSQKTTASPWKPAIPWLKSLLEQGPALQDAYAANPISETQRGAAENQFGLINSLMQSAPDLMTNYGILGQGYDRNAPNRTQTGYKPVQMQMPDFAQLSMSGVPNVAAGVPNNAQTMATAAPELTPQQQMETELEEWWRLIGSGA